MSNNQYIHKKWFFSKLKATKTINSRFLNWKNRELIKRFTSKSEEDNSEDSESLKEII